MNTLAALRQDLTAVLEDAGIDASSFLKGRFTPPVAFLVPGSPYLQQGQQFGSFQVAFQVLLVAPTRSSDFTTDELDQMLATAVVALDETDWFVEKASDPAGVTLGGAEYLGTFLDVHTTSWIDDGVTS